MPPKLARNKGSKEFDIEASPQILNLQWQIDSVHRFCSQTQEATPQLKQNLNKYKVQTDSGKEVIKLSNEAIHEMMKQSKGSTKQKS